MLPRSSTFISVLVLGCCLVPEVHAQVFPADSEYEPFWCGDEVMFDGFEDEAGALGPLDVVGDGSAPAGLRAVDPDFLYVRIRVDDDPTQGSNLRPFAWGMEVDLDGDLDTYELLMVADGVAGEIRLHENTTTNQANDPADPADQPPVATYAFATHGQVVVAGADFGPGDDFFVDIAVPWVDLGPLGLDPDTPLAVWVGTSNSALSGLDADLACHNGATGEPTLSGTASVVTVSDPDLDSDGDGYTDADELVEGTDPQDPDSVPGGTGESQLEGGGGCSVASTQLPIAVGLILFLLVVLRRRRAPCVRRPR